ncbi:MAG: LysR family transcriptional regulator [Pseudomonadota bacterium]
MGHPAFELDWNLVRTFVAVARAGSLAAGARDLDITHPTAARHVQQLEEALGMTLFSRTSKGLSLNEAGTTLLSRAEAMHTSALEFQSLTDSMRRQPLPRIRISVSDILAELLPELMLEQLGQAGEGGVALDVLVTADLVNLLQRDADIALRHVRPTQQDLVCRRIGQMDMGVFASRSYFAEYGRLTPQHAHTHRFVDAYADHYLVKGARARGYEILPEQLIVRSDSLACRRAAVSAGYGIGAFPLWMAERFADWVSVADEAEVIDTELWLVARPEVRTSAQLKSLFTQLGDRLQEAVGVLHPPARAAKLASGL